MEKPDAPRLGLDHISYVCSLSVPKIHHDRFSVGKKLCSRCGEACLLGEACWRPFWRFVRVTFWRRLSIPARLFPRRSQTSLKVMMLVKFRFLSRFLFAPGRVFGCVLSPRLHKWLLSKATRCCCSCHKKKPVLL